MFRKLKEYEKCNQEINMNKAKYMVIGGQREGLVVYYNTVIKATN